MMVIIAKGIKGIRAFLKKDAAGWHIFIGERYFGYSEKRVSEIFAELGDGYQFRGWVGNNLEFEELSRSSSD